MIQIKFNLQFQVYKNRKVENKKGYENKTSFLSETEKVSPTLPENYPTKVATKSNSQTETGPGSRWALIDTDNIQAPIPGN